MACSRPITVHWEDFASHKIVYREVPCGQCACCLKRKQNDFFIRATWHLKQYPLAVFFTLTYNEKSVPWNYDGNSGEMRRSLCYADVQGWLKRCSMQYFRKAHKKITYAICGEYGPKTFRPHYHGIFFGIDLSDFRQYFGSVWNDTFGFVNVRSVNPTRDGCLRYLAKYMYKGAFFNPKFVLNGFCEKPRRHTSVNFGMYFLTCYDSSNSKFLTCGCESVDSVKPWHYKTIVERQFVCLDGYKYSLPSYYRAKVFGKGQKGLENASSLAVRNGLSRFRESSRNAKFSELFRQLETNERITAYERSYVASSLSSRARSEYDTLCSFERFYDKSSF